MVFRLHATLALALSVTGCVSTPELSEVDLLLIQPDQYEAAFDAAEEAARAEGLTPAIRDRRGGVIETEAGRAPSLLEPWRWTGQSYRELAAATTNHARRRARFEFTAVGEPSREGEDLPAPDLLGVAETPRDLLRADGPLELRVWVSVEREHDPGVRRSLWSRGLNSRAILIAGNGAREDGSGPFWVPVVRDLFTEQRLLAAVERAVGDASSGVGAATQSR